ncbi:MAG TPA: hypothetical protein DCL54_06755 [Alphaproteobacteria bacterium]|nr:hypothetical protein [Alphaproteobacteria bacterium]HAJ46262.1 hypothetical protein [Alphaproteobacteria bacterium]
MRIALASACSLLAVLGLAGPANADLFPTSPADANAKSVVGFVGATVRENNNYAIVGAVAAFNGDLNKSGVIFNGSWEFLTYEYLANPVTPIQAGGFGLNALVGYQWVWGDGDKFSALAGVNHRSIDTDPADPLSDADGDNTSFKVQGEIYLNNPGWDFSGIASYATHQNAWFTRARVGIEVGSGVAIGPEVSFHGNEEYDTVEAGAFIRVPIDETTTLGVRGGYAESDESRSDGGYIGLEFSKAL